MVDRNNEHVVEKESAALKKLQGLAGIAEKGTSERLDWMYEQSTVQKSELEAMNTPVGGAVDKDMTDMKELSGKSTAGSLFLKGPATRTTEDMLRKLREDPLFQIRREEQAAKQSMMENPLIQARMRKKAEKMGKKDKKSAKKAAKKEKKAMKKAKKAAKKGGKKSSSSSDSSADSGGAPPAAAPAMAAKRPRSRSGGRARSRSPKQEPRREEKKLDLASLGPDTQMVSRREEYAARIADRQKNSLASRGAPKRMDEDEKRRRLEQMSADAKSHDAQKNKRIDAATIKEKEQDELEAKQRSNSDQKYFRDMREKAYMEENSSMESRLKNQRHRRQKGIVDSLEKDDR